MSAIALIRFLLSAYLIDYSHHHLGVLEWLLWLCCLITGYSFIHNCTPNISTEFRANYYMTIIKTHF